MVEQLCVKMNVIYMKETIIMLEACFYMLSITNIIVREILKQLQ